MIENRVNNVGLILGKRGTGKSVYNRDEIIPKYHFAQPTKKILLLSAINQPKYEDIPEIDIDLLRRWKRPAIYKIFGSNTDELIQEIELNFTNGLLIMEDATSFIPKLIPKEVRRMIIDTKQKDVDLLMTFHGFLSAPPEIIRYCDTITMFRTDHPQSRKNDIGAYYSDIEKAYYEILKSKNPYIKKTIKIT